LRVIAPLGCASFRDGRQDVRNEEHMFISDTYTVKTVAFGAYCVWSDLVAHR
jgi:hypothetical protein